MMASLLSVGGAYAIASYDWCGRWPAEEPQLAALGLAQGRLRAGAAKVALQPPYPVVVAGYGPLRPQVEKSRAPLFARAVVLQVEAVKVAIVSLDLLLVPAPLADEVRARVEGLGLGQVWLVATHAHSSLGGHDERLMAELAGTGRYRVASRAAIVEAVAGALRGADAALAPAELASAEGRAGELTVSRSGAEVDSRLTRLEIRGVQGAIAELIVFAAHPTLVPRDTDALDPDWPGALAARREGAGGVSLILQGAVGDASVAEGAAGVQAFADRLFEALAAVPLKAAAGEVLLGFSRVSVALPRPDSSRLPGVPRLLSAAGDNFVCASSPRRAEVSGLRLGPLALLAVPVEPTLAAARVLETSSGAHRAVALANGYLGYLEPEGVVAAAGGESKRQYFDGTLEQVLAQGARLAGQALKLAPEK